MKRFISLTVALSLLCLATQALAAPVPPVMSYLTDGTNITISWNEVEGATGYKLHYAPYPFAGMDTIGTLDVSNETTMSFALWRGVAYYITVTAYDESGDSEYSNVEFFIMGPPSPEWVDDDGDGTTEVDGDCNDTNASIGPGETEICGDGIDQNCSGVDLVCPDVLTPPFLSHSVVDVEVTINWSAVSDATGYKLYYAPTPFAGTETYDVADVGDNTSQTFTLWRGASYHVVVTAYNSYGESGESNSTIISIEQHPDDVDNDGDGFTEYQGDCDDSDQSINSEAIEICGDGIDQDCSGNDQICLDYIDPSVLLGTWYLNTNETDYGGGSGNFGGSLQGSYLVITNDEYRSVHYWNGSIDDDDRYPYTLSGDIILLEDEEENEFMDRTVSVSNGGTKLTITDVEENEVEVWDKR